MELERKNDSNQLKRSLKIEEKWNQNGKFIRINSKDVQRQEKNDLVDWKDV